MTGAGIKEFFDAVEASRTEYEKSVVPIFFAFRCCLTSPSAASTFPS